jgi:1-acyl-sn-glycerol-3-phosphate acyltransferase
VLRRYDVTVEAEGTENIPEGSVLFVSNHQGYGDILVLFDVINNKQFGFVARGNLAKIPVFGKWIKRIRSLFLERENNREALKIFREGENLLKTGYSLAIFPEGTRSQGDEMGVFKKGSLQLATRSNVPIVPISISGTWRLFEKEGVVRSGKVRVFIHSPIPTENMTKAEKARLPDKVEAQIKAKVAELATESGV